MKKDIKQEAIEKYIDNQDKIQMGKEFNALLILEARKSGSKGKATQFIIDFSKGLGFKFHFDTAIRIIHYCYPEKRMSWNIWDKMYSEIVNNSGWLKYNLKK